MKVEVWSETDPMFNHPQVAGPIPNRVWYYRILQEGGYITECDEGYATKQEAEDAGERHIQDLILIQEEDKDGEDDQEARAIIEAMS